MLDQCIINIRRNIMTLTGPLELEERQNPGKKPYVIVTVGGTNAGTAFKNQVEDFKTGDYVKVTSVKKGEYNNVKTIEKVDPPAPTLENPNPTEVPWPRGHNPHPVIVNNLAFIIANDLVKGMGETKLTKKSVATRLGVLMTLVKPVREYLLNGTLPDGIEQLSDEE